MLYGSFMNFRKYVHPEVCIAVFSLEWWTLSPLRDKYWISWDCDCVQTNSIHCMHLSCEQDQDRTSWSCSQAVSKPVLHIPLLCVQWKTPDDGQWNCPKHVNFYSKNKFEKSVHLVGFIIRIQNFCPPIFCLNNIRIQTLKNLPSPC